ncbi:heavy metal translocating P-type ATPase [Auraticoccus monumenti]|uniref:Cu+-exporting ATPase n=1 Tax=Auraticoccus monumenti TaxID=675864 RepID=A0A1G6XDW4_9ACTN|nr:heavy metal translocating P-type ATPase [Auraticoccus monumenti]SDD76434.1 Cu+-exporting ATPase [Auraticoccus monumenti]
MSTPTTARPEALPTTRTREYDLEGMTCSACANRIERKLNKLEGVSAVVNYATERAVLSGPEDGLDDRVVKAVRAAGYDARVVDRDADPDDTSHPDRTRSLRWRIALGALTTVPLGSLTIILALVPELRFPGWEWLAVALATPTVTWGAWPFHRATLRNLRHGATSMDTLVSLGITAAYLWSVVSIVIGPASGPGYWLGYGVTPEGADAIYLEVATAVTTFLLTGRYVEARSRRAASDVLGALNALAATTVRVVRDGVEEVRPVGELRRGDEFSVRPGETVAADGTVVDGTSSVDTSMMTGEPTPTDVVAGSSVLGGTINRSGRLLVRAERVGAGTQLAQMATMAEQAQARKARVQQLVDRVVTVFVPVALGIAAITLVGWLLTGGTAREAFNAAVSVLIIACPCAMGLATPTALMVGVGRAGQLGIVIKGPSALESSGVIDTVVLDKTGTLTTGAMSLVGVHPVGGADRDEVLRLAGAVEQHSEHPIGRAVVAAALEALGRDTGPTPGGAVALPAAEGFTALSGLGAEAVVEGRRALVGNRALLAERGVTVDPATASRLDQAEAAGRTAVLLAVDGAAAGVLELADTVKPSAPEAVARLRALGLRTVLLTGDSRRVAEQVGRELGTDEVVAEVLPADKAAHVERLQAQGRRVAMVGDGINDAAALATADLGMAVVSGTDLAMKSADMILVRSHLGVVADAVSLSRRTLATIRGNLVWAFAYNVAAIPLAAFGLLNPLVAGLAMSLSSLFVVGNSLRLRGYDPSSR